MGRPLGDAAGRPLGYRRPGVVPSPGRLVVSVVPMATIRPVALMIPVVPLVIRLVSLVAGAA